MADSSSVDVNIITDAVDASGSVVISAVQSNTTESTVATANVITGGIGPAGADGSAGITEEMVIAYAVTL